jgi:hypothetical protein
MLASDLTVSFHSTNRVSTHAKPDDRESEPSHAPFRAAVNKSTDDKRAHGIQSLLVFACALEHISSAQDIPDAWNWGESRETYWKDYVSRFPRDPIWKAIQEFKAGLRQPDGQTKRLGGLIWALARQGMNIQMGAWDRIFERFIIARIVDPRSIARSTPLFHRVTTMASEASQLSWIMRAAAVLQIQDAKNTSPLDDFDYQQCTIFSHVTSSWPYAFLPGTITTIWPPTCLQRERLHLGPCAQWPPGFRAWSPTRISWRLTGILLGSGHPGTATTPILLGSDRWSQ